jgi:chorismate mutase
MNTQSKPSTINDSLALESWRQQIDQIDDELLHVLARRMIVIKKIGLFKKNHGIAPLDQRRWQIVLHSKLALAKSLDLSEKLVKGVYELIHEQALKIESNLK